MNQQQSTLPFSQLSAQNFKHFKGNESVVETLRQPQNLPQFIYIWGDDYSGKTHLLNAFENELNEAKIACFAVDAIYLTQVDLVQVLPEGLSFLLLDGVQVLAGEAAAELALFNLFNHCKAQGITLLVSASINSRSVVWQLPDLISRLNSGLSLNLHETNKKVVIVRASKSSDIGFFTINKCFSMIV